jgi:tRNA nucleotidyltransferase/poly(A) polymerase
MNETMINPTIETSSSDADFRKMLAKLNPDLASKTLEPSLTIEIKDIRSNLDVEAAAKAGLEASKNGIVDIESVLSKPKSSEHFTTIYAEQRKTVEQLEEIVKSLKTQPQKGEVLAELKGIDSLINELKGSSEKIGGNNNKESEEISGLRKAYNNIVSFVRKN